MSNSKKITKNLGGRPTKQVPEVVNKLEDIFKVGGTVEEAISYAGISKQTYYDWIKADESFLTKMEAARHYSDVVAKNVVIDSIVKDRDLSSAKWWLEKRQFNQPMQTNIQVNVKPLLGGSSVSGNHSNEEDIIINQED